MEIVFQIILLVIIGVIIKNVKLGVALYIAYSFLVPYCKLGFGGLVLQQNLINTIILLIVCLNTKRIDLRPFYAFIVFYILLFIEIPFTNGLSIVYQLDQWRSNMMLTMFVPIALWNMLTMKNPYDLTRKFLLIVIVISCIYGLILTTMHGINPYAMLFYSIKGNEYRLDWFASDSRLFGRISSFFDHPMNYGMFLGCALIYIYSLRKKLNSLFLYICIALIIANIVICGIRSLLFAYFIVIIFYLLLCRRFKVVMYILTLITVIYLIGSQIPDFAKYFSDVSDISDRSNISGSNLEMRLSQLRGCFKEINDCMLIGKGFAWHSYYMSIKVVHPEILAFESLIFVILCDHGILGIFIYASMVIILLYTQRLFIKDYTDRLLLTCYVVFYLSYCIFTGDYSYMKIWLLFYYITFSEMYISQGDLSIKLRIKELLMRKNVL